MQIPDMILTQNDIHVKYKFPIDQSILTQNDINVKYKFPILRLNAYDIHVKNKYKYKYKLAILT